MSTRKKLKKALKRISRFCAKQKTCATCPFSGYTDVESCEFEWCPAAWDISEMIKKKKEKTNG